MKIITEADLRAELVGEKGIDRYYVTVDTFVTPLAKEYLAEHKIELVYEETMQTNSKSYSTNKVPETFIDLETGAVLDKKPERMTHLYGNRLVPKTNKRIILRGRLDSLQSEIILWQTIAHQKGYQELVSDLDGLLRLSREILRAEVCEQVLPDFELCGMTSDELHYASQHVKEYFGFSHPIPGYQMGVLAAGLNKLRTQVRETELVAEQAFAETDKQDSILKALNRMSSAVHVLYCRLLAGQYERR